jgi:hypothetical protein
MDIYRLGEALPPVPGVYLFAGQANRRWTCLFVGETTDLRSRTTAHEALPEALLLGATHVHAAAISGGSDRQYLAERLVFMCGPELNASDAPTLSDLIGSAPAAPPPSAPGPHLVRWAG